MMLPINNWKVEPNEQNPYLLRLIADNAVFNMTPDQARRIADALISVAHTVEFNRRQDVYAETWGKKK